MGGAYMIIHVSKDIEIAIESIFERDVYRIGLLRRTRLVS